MLTIRPASPQDMTGISLLLDSARFVHRHLDWRMHLEWLDFQPFWVLERSNRLVSILATPPEPPHVAWVRLFATGLDPDPRSAWQALFGSCLAELPPRSQTTIAALGLSDWFSGMLPQVGFAFHQDVVVLAWDNHLPRPRPIPPEVRIRPITRGDLPAVQRIDAQSFEPIWQNSLTEIDRSLLMSGCATLAEMDGQVIGYQVSTISHNHLHLARLAVDPSIQRLSIGYGIVYDLLSFCQREMITQVTVNTQDSNIASLGLYQKCNFHLTGESFPVYIYA